jgi:nicotinate phosphoribosyltransferase
VKIFASGDLDEYKIEDLLKKGAKIDAFGVGTRMGTSYDKPSVDVVYKLCERTDKTGKFVPTIKLSKNKMTLPGRKQVFRVEKNEFYVKDIIGLEGEKIDGEPLLIKVMERGKVIHELPSLEEIREKTLKNLSKLPEKYKKLRNAPRYPVELSSGLKKLIDRLVNKRRV